MDFYLTNKKKDITITAIQIDQSLLPPTRRPTNTTFLITRPQQPLIKPLREPVPDRPIEIQPAKIRIRNRPPLLSDTRPQSSKKHHAERTISEKRLLILDKDPIDHRGRVDKHVIDLVIIDFFIVLDFADRFVLGFF